MYETITTSQLRHAMRFVFSCIYVCLVCVFAVLGVNDGGFLVGKLYSGFFEGGPYSKYRYLFETINFNLNTHMIFNEMYTHSINSYG